MSDKITPSSTPPFIPLPDTRAMSQPVSPWISSLQGVANPASFIPLPQVRPYKLRDNEAKNKEMFAAKDKTPREKHETSLQYAYRLGIAAPHLTHAQLADAAGVTPITLHHSPLFRKPNEAIDKMRSETHCQPDETPLEYGIRLKMLYPNYCLRDYATVAGVSANTLGTRPLFQKVTEGVIRAQTESPRLPGETQIEWGLRLKELHGLNASECSAATGALLNNFRRTKVFDAQQLIDTSACDAQGVTVPANLLDLAGIEYRDTTPSASPAPSTSCCLPEPGVAQHDSTSDIYNLPLSPMPLFGLQDIHNIAELMLREPGSFNNQLGDQVVQLLLNSGRLPADLVISVIQDGEQQPLYFRGVTDIPVNRAPSIGEATIALVRSGEEDCGHYNLFQDGVKKPNQPDGDCLYRAIAQGLGREDTAAAIAELRGHAAQEFTNNHQQYLQAVDLDTFQMEYLQLLHQNKLVNVIHPPSSTSILEVDNVSIASSASTISFDDPVVGSNKRKQKSTVRAGQSEKLPDLLSRFIQTRNVYPETLLNWISDEQIISWAAMGIESAEGEKVGAYVIHEVTSTLLNLLNRHRASVDDVAAAFLPTTRDLQLSLVNTLPLIMNQRSGLRVSQLIRRLSSNVATRQKIHSVMREKYTSDSPLTLEFIQNQSFYARIKNMSQRLTAVQTAKAFKEAQQKGIKASLDSAKETFDQSVKELHDAGLITEPSVLNQFFSFERQNLKRPALERKHSLDSLLPENNIFNAALVDDLQQRDRQNFERFQNRTLALREQTRQIRTQQDAKASQSLRLSSLMTDAATMTAAARGAYLATARNAEKEQQWEADKEMQWQESRAVRDVSSEQLRHQALETIMVDAPMHPQSVSSEWATLPLAPTLPVPPEEDLTLEIMRNARFPSIPSGLPELDFMLPDIPDVEPNERHGVATAMLDPFYYRKPDQ